MRLAVLALGILLLSACNPVSPAAPGGTVPPLPADAASGGATGAQGDPGVQMANAMLAVLASQLGIATEDIPRELTVESVEAVEWPDACLGVTLEGEMCAQVITPGYIVTLTAKGETYVFHTDAGGNYRPAEGPEAQAGATIAEWRGTADNGSCLQASFSAGGVNFGPCDGVLTEGRYVSPARVAVLQEMAGRFAPFTAETELGMIDFKGTGAVQASDDEKAFLVRWAQTAAMEAQAGTSFTGLRYEGPEELGSDDTSLCAVLQIGENEAQVWGCDGAVTTVPLNETQAAAWNDIAGRFGGFVLETPSERLTFEGMGMASDPAWQRALLAWARVTRAELSAGGVSATARTAAGFNLGPAPDSPGVCAHLTVLDYGYVYAEQRACEGGALVTSVEDWLSDDEMQQFDRWLYDFAPLYAEDNYLDGAGAEQMSDEEAAAVETWAREVWTRLSGLPLGPDA
jgi:hypothetical protein